MAQKQHLIRVPPPAAATLQRAGLSRLSNASRLARLPPGACQWFPIATRRCCVKQVVSLWTVAAVGTLGRLALFRSAGLRLSGCLQSFQADKVQIAAAFHLQAESLSRLQEELAGAYIRAAVANSQSEGGAPPAVVQWVHALANVSLRR